MPMIRFNALRKNRPILTYGGMALIIITLLLITVRISITPVAKFGIIDWLNKHGVTATIEDIRLDISKGKLFLIGFDAHNADGDGAHIGTLELDWQWKPLAGNSLKVNFIHLDNFHIDTLLYADGKMNIAGLQLPLPADDEPAEVKPLKNKVASPEPFDISLASIQFSNISTCVKQFDTNNKPMIDYCASLGALDWNGNIHYTLNPKTDSGDLPLTIKGVLALKDLQAKNNTLQRKLISIESIKLSDIQLTGLKQISLKQISIDTLAALERSDHDKADKAQLLAFQKLRINGLTLKNMNALAINSIALTDTSAYLHIKKNGKFEFDEWLPASDTAETKPAASNQARAVKSAFQYSLGSLQYVSTQPISFVDDSLKEPFSYVLPTLTIALGPIDSSQPETLTTIKLEASTSNHAKINVAASIDPLAAKPDLNGKIIISGLDLRALSPLTKEYIGHSIRSGQLDSDIKLKADKGILNSNIALTLNQFELRSLNKKEAKKLDSDLGFPLNTALSLLRDSDNRIKLDIPVTGDINNPDFDPADAIRTATSKAVTAAVLYYYTPYGLILAANAAFDIATALRFDPVTFDAGQSTLNPKQTKQLDSVASMLSERPGVHLTLCGISNRGDTALLYPDVIKAAEKSETRKIILNDAQTKALLQLAEKRGTAVKNYLVDNKKIDASRLIVCEPEYREDSKQAVVEISI